VRAVHYTRGMDTAQDHFPLRVFAIAVISGAVALGGLGTIALHSFHHFHPVPRPALPRVECEPAPLLAANPPPEAPTAPPKPEPAPSRRRPKTHPQTQTTKPPGVGLAFEDCKREGDPLCGIALGKER
jgi:hypothetical protein